MAGTTGKTSATGGRPGNAAKGPTVPPGRTWLVFFVLLVVNYFLVTLLAPERDAPAPISYTLFRSELAKDNVEANYQAYLDWLLAQGIIKTKTEAKDLVTNDLLDEIDNFNPAAVAADAKAYKGK